MTLTSQSSDTFSARVTTECAHCSCRADGLSINTANGMCCSWSTAPAWTCMSDLLYSVSIGEDEEGGGLVKEVGGKGKE